MLAHGFASPDNVAFANYLQQIIRGFGAIPALIGVHEGLIRVGASPEQTIAIVGCADVPAISRRDLPKSIMRRETAVTTVSGTMACAHLAGIRIIATGGIGGVHRGYMETMDVSADLDALAQLPVAVVAAGAKAILDLPRTLEFLEARSVSVVGFGTDSFPPYYSRTSELAVQLRIDSADEVAQFLRIQDRLGGCAGTLIANPIAESFALPYESVDEAVQLALADAARRKLTGKAITPAVMKRLAELTGGGSQSATKAIAEANAQLAAAIAVAYADQMA